jgi:hypothetical protein
MKKAPPKRGLRRRCGGVIGTPYPALRTVRRHLSAGPTLNAVSPSCLQGHPGLILVSVRRWCVGAGENLAPRLYGRPSPTPARSSRLSGPDSGEVWSQGRGPAVGKRSPASTTAAGNAIRALELWRGATSRGPRRGGLGPGLCGYGGRRGRAVGARNFISMQDARRHMVREGLSTRATMTKCSQSAQNLNCQHKPLDKGL